ncbi:MAG: agmatinase family protein [Rikenellaceae bacterium]
MGEELINFNPNGVGVVGGGFFSLPFTVESARVVILSAPWDVTVSYGSGSAAAPEALKEASSQLDLYDPSSHDAWREGIATLPISKSIADLSAQLRPIAERVIEHLEAGGDIFDATIAESVAEVNRGSEELNDYIYREAHKILAAGKVVALVGGDHSTPYGAIKALGEFYDSFGVLHIDAHRDLRVAYEGFEFSHASVMYNVLRDVEQVERLVQLGVRDYCDDEQEFSDNSNGRVVSFPDISLARGRFEGETWGAQARRIVETLPQKVYVSFDIDGLQMGCCPHTGTPVPGGVEYNEAIYLLELLVESGREIIGFDVVEVVPSETDVIDLAVGARLIYKLCGLAIKGSSQRAQIK